MTDLHDLDDSSLVVDRVHDAIGTLPNPVTHPLTGELLASGGAWSAREALDPGNDPRSERAGFYGFEFLDRRRLDQDAIACHDAGGP
jgi:hypothetical protein